MLCGALGVQAGIFYSFMNKKTPREEQWLGATNLSTSSVVKSIGMDQNIV